MMNKIIPGIIIVCIFLLAVYVILASSLDETQICMENMTPKTSLYQELAVESVHVNMEDAKNIADDYIITQNINGELRFDGIESRPPHAKDLAGKYSVHFSRIIKGIPCLSDGIRVGVNPDNGDIMSYHRTWSMPEEEMSVNPVPTVQNSEAKKILCDFMKEKYSTEITPVSSKLVWMDINYPVQMDGCHDIRLTWMIRFEDSYLQQNEATPGSAWIDAHSGEILKKAYFV